MTLNINDSEKKLLQCLLIRQSERMKELSKKEPDRELRKMYNKESNIASKLYTKI